MEMKITSRKETGGCVLLVFGHAFGCQSLTQAMTIKEAEPFQKGSIWDVEIKKTLVRAAE